MYDWKTKIAKCWNTTSTTGYQQQTSLGIQPVRLDNKDSEVLDDNLYNCKTKIAKSWNTTCTNGNQRQLSFGMKLGRLETKDNQVLDYNLYDWKQIQPCVGLQPVRLEINDRLVLEYSLYDWTTKITKSWMTTCTTGKQKQPSLGIQPL